MKLIVILLLAISSNGYCQTIAKLPYQINKGSFYAYWGWNRGYYSRSDIHFTGDSYDFTLKDVLANDRPSDVTSDNYLNPMNLTIAQTQFRLGYYFSDHYDISFGVDHMKYVMQEDQFAYINGSISNTNTKYDKIYNNELLKLTRDFLQYEHTDGLTYINFELRRSDKLIDLSKLLHMDICINHIEGAGFGIMFPRTDAKLLNNSRNDEFHIAGYGMALVSALNLTVLKHYFIQLELKAGYINLPNVRTTPSIADKAKQSIYFLQTSFALGGKVSLSEK